MKKVVRMVEIVTEEKEEGRKKLSKIVSRAGKASAALRDTIV